MQQKFIKKWDKKLYEFGIFEDDILPYQCRDRKKRKDLQILKESDSGYIFNQFLEILRHNGISDKPNAFNKILNLFLCKIADEEKNSEDDVEFYWDANTTHMSMQSKLEALYKKGMEEYLNIKITDYPEIDIRTKLDAVIGQSNPGLVDYVVKALSETKCHKSSEFAFKEIYNEETFNANAKVVKEVVELLQPYQFRYGHKQQFLGNFFENLLSTSIKQEVGQFFTPVPIAKFMITSLPLAKALTDKAKKATNGKSVTNVIPTVIDYSCGSGHFLTEFMDLMQKVIDDCDTSVFTESVKKKIRNQQESEFDWASECVYGIEKDYRLVKTTKISTFLNGDGEANIIHADGLTAFGESNFQGLLSKEGQFDFVIANPPYSVSNFKAELTNKDFSGYKYLTDDSKEIECLFVERTAQLLKTGGYAAVILPTSVIQNSGIYEDARQNIIKHFFIRAIAKMGKNTFMSTDVETVILFLEKRNPANYMDASNAVDKFLLDKTDFNIFNIQNAIAQYAQQNDLSFDDYVSILNLNPTNTALQSNYFALSQQSKKKNTLSERDKIINYIFTANNNCVVVNTGEKDQEKDFIGYYFSKRRGSEGLHMSDEGSSLYDVENPLSDDNTKVNYLIREIFKGNVPQIPDALKDNVVIVDTCNLIDFATGNKISTFPRLEFNDILKTTKPLLPIKDVCSVLNGFAFKSEKYTKDGIRIIRIANVQNGYIEDKTPVYYPRTDSDANKYLLNEKDLLMSLTGNIGRVALLDKSLLPAALNQRVACLRVKDEDIINKEYLYYLLSYEQFANLCFSASSGVAQKNLSTDWLGLLKIPCPDKSIQEDIVKECSAFDRDIEAARAEIQRMENEIEHMVSTMGGTTVLLGDKSRFSLSIGTRMLKKDIKGIGKYPVYSANVNKPFGYSNELLIDDFSIGSAIWGIDTDWQTGYLEKDYVFRPTDHCGYLRPKSDDIAHPYILSKLLYKAGLSEHFTRDYRASIDRIEKLQILLPDITVQNDIAAKALKLEREIANKKALIASAQKAKDDVLRKYLK